MPDGDMDNRNRNADTNLRCAVFEESHCFAAAPLTARRVYLSFCSPLRLLFPFDLLDLKRSCWSRPQKIAFRRIPSEPPFPLISLKHHDLPIVNGRNVWARLAR